MCALMSAHSSSRLFFLLLLAGCASRGATEDTSSPIKDSPALDGGGHSDAAPVARPDAEVDEPEVDAGRPMQHDAAPQPDVPDAATMDAQVDPPVPTPDASTRAEDAGVQPEDPTLPEL